MKNRFPRSSLPAMRALTLLALVSCARAAPARVAPSALDEIVAREVLRVGMTGDYKPFSFRPTKAGDIIGLDVVLADELARSLGVKLRIVPTTWPALMRDFTEGRFDIAMGGVSITPERQAKGVFSVPYVHDGKTPIARCESQARLSTLAQIDQPGTRLIVNPGGTNERFARAQAPHATLRIYPDNVTIFDRIVEGDADLMITDAIEARLRQRLHPELCAVHPDAPFDVSEKAIWLPRDGALEVSVNRWLRQAIATGHIQREMERWLDFPWGLDRLRQLLDARLLLAVDVARHKWNTHGAIEDRGREDEIVRSVGRRALALGLSVPWTESFFRAQIEASKIVQREHFARWEKEHAGAFDGVPDLAKVLRPRLDELTTQLLNALVEDARLLADPSRREDAIRLLGILDAAAISPAAAEQALKPFNGFPAR